MSIVRNSLTHPSCVHRSDAHPSTAIDHHLYPHMQFRASCSACAKLLYNTPLSPSAQPPRVCPISFSLSSVSFASAHACPSVCPPFTQPRFHVTSVTTVRCSNLREGRRPWLPPVPQHAPRSGAPALLLPPRLQSTLAAAAHPTRAAHCNRSGGREEWRGQHAARQGLQDTSCAQGRKQSLMMHPHAPATAPAWPRASSQRQQQRQPQQVGLT